MSGDPVGHDHRVLLTGAAGGMASFLRSRLSRPGRTLRLLDRSPVPDPGEREEVVTGSVTDSDVIAAACRGVDAIVHLAGIPNEAPWEQIVSTNVEGARAVLEACVQERVPKVLLASSNHAVGLIPLDQRPIPAEAGPQPDSFYGWSKAAVELLGRLYQQRFGLDVLCLRIGRCAPRPPDRRSLINWLSPDDLGRLVEAGLVARAPGFRTVWAVSANSRGVFDLSPGHALGYQPRDNAEDYADDVSDGSFTLGDDRLVGGHFAERPLGVRPGRGGRPVGQDPDHQASS